MKEKTKYDWPFGLFLLSFKREGESSMMKKEKWINDETESEKKMNNHKIELKSLLLIDMRAHDKTGPIDGRPDSRMVNAWLGKTWKKLNYVIQFF